LCCSLLTLPLLLRREAYQMTRSSGERAKTNRQIKKPTDNANKVNEPNNQKRCLQLQSLHVQRHTVEPVQIECIMLSLHVQQHAVQSLHDVVSLHDQQHAAGRLVTDVCSTLMASMN